MRRAGALVISVALMLLGTGCFESKYRYVVSGAEKVSFRVPDRKSTRLNSSH